jgi:hypothetical protein
MKRQALRFAPWVALMILGVVGTSRPANTEPQERHPRIRAALNELRDANEYMKAAPHDFCGHKRAAMRATEAAITQLQLAQECAREH